MGTLNFRCHAFYNMTWPWCHDQNNVFWYQRGVKVWELIWIDNLVEFGNAIEQISGYFCEKLSRFGSLTWKSTSYIWFGRFNGMGSQTEKKKRRNWVKYHTYLLLFSDLGCDVIRCFKILSSWLLLMDFTLTLWVKINVFFLKLLLPGVFLQHQDN